MNYELRCEKLCEKHRENPAELNLIDKGFLDLEAANFWSCVEIKSAADCWPWGGGRSHAMSVREKTIQSHKMAWCLAADLSAVPKGKRLLILCANPICCNPAHIAVGRIKFVNGRREKIVEIPPVLNHEPITNFKPEIVAEDNRTEKMKWLDREKIRENNFNNHLTSRKLA